MSCCLHTLRNTYEVFIGRGRSFLQEFVQDITINLNGFLKMI